MTQRQSPWHTPSLLHATLLLVVLVFAPRVPTGAQELPWSALEFQAKKLFLKANVRIESEVESAAQTALRLEERDDFVSLPPQSRNFSVLTKTRLLDRHTEIRTHLELRGFGGLQRALVESGSRNRFKTYRFGPQGVLAIRGEPANAQEAGAPSPQWSRTSTQVHPLDAPGATDPIALLLAATQLPRDVLREGRSFFVFSGNDLQHVRLVETGLEQHPVRFDIGEERVDGLRALRILEIRAPATAGKEPFEMLGLEGDLTVRVDLEHRVPVEIEGRMPVLGTVTIRLQKAEPTASSG